MIRYSEEKKIPAAALEALFSTVGWESSKYPERLERAMPGFSTVYSAWEGEKLVGLLAAMDDGEMTAYIHYLLVDTAFQGRGIGKALLSAALERYRGYTRVVLHAEGNAEGFYRRFGFQPMDAVSMCRVPAEAE